MHTSDYARLRLAARAKALASRWLQIPLALVVLSACIALPKFGGPARTAYVYPPARTVEHVDDYHGTAVKDPYRWLEDLDGAETQGWVAAQNALTAGELAKVSARPLVQAKLTQLWNFERYSLPDKHRGRYFFSKNDGLQNQAVLYWSEGLAGEPKLLLNPNELSGDGTVALSGQAVSEDGEYLAYGLSESGSDWQTWRVREVKTGKDLPDTLRWVKFSGATWTRDGKGFFYGRYAEPAAGDTYEQVNYNQKLYYHKLGTEQSADVLVYERPDHKEWGYNADVTEDGRFLVIHISEGTDRRNRVYYRDVKNKKQKNPKFVELLDGFDASYELVGNDGEIFWFHTDLDAPRGRLIAIDTRRPERQYWRDVIPQSKDTLLGVRTVGDRFVASYLQDAHARVSVHTLDGKLEREVELPGLGSVAGFEGRRDQSETFYRFTSFTDPGSIYRYDVKTGQVELHRATKLAFDASQYETKQVFYVSKDGTRVPMFITHRKGLVLDGSHPTYLYGYGGFNASMTPAFSVPNIVWLEMGGVYAQANLRGGGEYGEAWHQAGMKLKKQNVFDDFIAAGEWLVSNKYTSRDKLSIGGRSNGGLLVGAAITQRPDLFGAALAGVGVMDMLRFEKFTIGWAWASDYGTVADAEQFKALYAYSPYHNVKPGTKYPATLIFAADHDDRVVPSHSYKFGAAMQAAQAGPEPILMRIDTKAGHGAGKPVSKTIEEWADLWSFLVLELDMQLPPSFAPPAPAQSAAVN